MTAVLIIQALVFQDGGILALGANVINLAVAGVLAAFLPYWLFGNGRFRTGAMFGGAFLSVMVSGGLAISQILLSGIQIPAAITSAALLFFLVSGIIEGILTVLVVRGIEKLNPNWVRQPARSAPVARVLAVSAVVLGCCAFLLASTQPDSLEKIAEGLGIAGRATTLMPTPFADYEFLHAPSATIGKIAAAIAGLALVYFVCVAVGKVFGRRSA
jgi:cobalt/nickel transport system permease protein